MIRKIIADQKTQGRRIGLVPTMGALHQGHLSLIHRSVDENDVTVVSIFVNPLQFGKNEDLNSYPRTLKEDAAAAERAGADYIFSPGAGDILGDSMLAFVDINKLQDNLCGASRPRHFRGVCTIVAKLFNIITPHRAYFGQKDIQQFTILQRMVLDLNYDIEMIRCPIIRESDGLAMSSRNKYLSDKERQDALVLSRALRTARQMYESGEKSTAAILAAVENILKKPATARLDYADIVDPNMQHATHVTKGDVLAVAVFIGTTRLIDNFIFGDDAL